MMNATSALLVGLLLATIAAGCSSGATAGSASRSPGSPGASAPARTGEPGGRVPASEAPDTGVIGGGGGVPGGGGPKLVFPKPGTNNPRPVPIESIEANVQGRTVTLVATWWSGVEPCHVLDSVAVEREGNTFTVSLTEGGAGGDVACIEIAIQKATTIELGELPPGQYTVVAEGGMTEPVVFTVG